MDNVDDARTEKKKPDEPQGYEGFVVLFGLC